MSFYAVITTIQEPTLAVRELNLRLCGEGGTLVVVGDKKGPFEWTLSSCDFLDLESQFASGFALAGALPTGHYSRKNIGYLHAMRAGSTCIYETDDDNAPLGIWRERCELVRETRVLSADLSGWINAYSFFSSDKGIWPRGLPLDHILVPTPAVQSVEERKAPVQQGLVNGSPDVDAIWRLTQDRPFDFEMNLPLWLAPGQWCPFNTQSTWWFPAAYPLMYVPSYCSFRMCDIWKSFVAQRCLWAMGFGVVFHAPEVIQERNLHKLIKDFEDEIPGYLNNARIADILTDLDLKGVPSDDLLVCYQALVAEGVFPEEELALVRCWLKDQGGAHG
jgi:hypothetical protein